MIYVLGLAAGIWVLGRSLKVSVQARLLMLGLLYVAVLALLIIAPQASQFLGGSLGEWAALGVLAGLILGYRRVLSYLNPHFPSN